MTRALWILLAVCLLAGCNLDAAQPAVGTPASAETGADTLAVAWAENGSLMYWRAGDPAPRRIASGGVVRVYLAPSGQQVAFTRGPQGEQETLWVADAAGTAEQEIVGLGDIRTARPGRPLINQVAWLDDTTLYLNTLQASQNNLEAIDDLYRVNPRTREVALLLRPGEGGQFAFSPDREKIVVVYHGTYGRRDGRIRVVDLLGQEQTNLLFFVGVSTGSQYSFYPNVFWKPDSSAVLAAIPDSDLIYDETKPTTLWNLPVDVPGNRSTIGTLAASFFGQPQWSPSGQHLFYLRRVGDPAQNRFELVVADGDGQNPAAYAAGEVGSFEPGRWLPESERFIYAQGQPGAYWLGAPGAEPRRIPNEAETLFSPRFVGDDLLVFATQPTEGGVQLRYARLSDGGATSTLIAESSDPLPVFDAVIIPD